MTKLAESSDEGCGLKRGCFTAHDDDDDDVCYMPVWQDENFKQLACTDIGF
jgi:hypothetical protein